MLLDKFMPRYQFRECHQTFVNSPPEILFQATKDMDLRRSPLIHILFRLREMPWKIIRRRAAEPGFGHTLNDLVRLGFIPLADEPPHEFCMGIVGCFWQPSPDLVQMPGDQFSTFDDPGYAKAATNFQITPLNPAKCRLTTETRVWCPSLKTQKRFRRYWVMIRPFSGLIRREMLKIAKQSAETTYLMKGHRQCS